MKSNTNNMTAQKSLNPTEVAVPLARRPWVKPALERLALREALSTCFGGDDMNFGGTAAS